MMKPKKLVITELPQQHYEAFNQLASYFHLTILKFLISLMLQNGLISGGLENFMPDQDAEVEWQDQLIQRQFQWANSL